MVCVDEGLPEDVEYVIDFGEDEFTKVRRERSEREFK
jgi:hypothetical protein